MPLAANLADCSFATTSLVNVKLTDCCLRSIAPVDSANWVNEMPLYDMITTHQGTP